MICNFWPFNIKRKRLEKEKLRKEELNRRYEKDKIEIERLKEFADRHIKKADNQMGHYSPHHAGVIPKRSGAAQDHYFYDTDTDYSSSCDNSSSGSSSGSCSD